MLCAIVTNIQGYSIHDGPGIRTVVFLKGCTLACQWCSNPECISPSPEVGFLKALCNKCGKCLEVCPNEALSFNGVGPLRIDREKCSGCGTCSTVCDYKAIVPHGKSMSVDEVFDAVSRDSIFYQASGGGVTVSGGEPLLQHQFVRDLFDKCHQAGIHTCLETCGHVPESAFRQVLPYTDYVLYDIKHLNTSKHLQFTGKPNSRILKNAKLVAGSGVKVLFRMPLIPGINDDSQNIRETTDFLKGLGDIASNIELMPYHRLGKGKYASLDKPYLLSELMPSEPHHVESVKKKYEDLGIRCSISR
jgi:pyruvate formate lyase activating enzyme